MQTNTIDVMASDAFSGGWSAIPYGYSDYSSVPSADWMTTPATNLESARHSCDTMGQQNNFFQPASGKGIHRIPSQASPIETIEADSSQNSYSYATSYHHQHQTVSYAPHQQPQPARKLSTAGARYVPQGYYTQTGCTLTTVANGSPVPQPSLYPSPPGQMPPSDETSYNSKPFGMVYMNGNHTSAPIGYTGYTEPTLTNLCNGPVSNDLYQPYNVSSMGYGSESAPAFSAISLPPLDLPYTPLKYDAWNSESSIIQPLMSPMEHPIAIKQEYISSAYNSPSPSTIAGGSCIKMELLSDTSRSPPLISIPVPDEQEPSQDTCKPSPSPHLPPPPTKPIKTGNHVGSVPARKVTRKSNNYGDQYACQECQRTFARQCGLTQHIKWHHTGDKPFRCATCGKCFSEQVALDDHLERHTSIDKPHQCKQCPKAFFHKNDLRRHGFQHTGKAPHACRYCSKTFARKDHCHSHEVSHERKLQRKQRKVKTDTTQQTN